MGTHANRAPWFRHQGRHRGRVAAAATAVAAGLAGAICIGIAVTHQHHAPEPVRSAPPRTSVVAGARAGSVASGPLMARSVPVSLSIPSIKVTSRLLELGRQADGTIQVPQPGPHYDQAGWYRFSPTPGSLGPAVIVGHVDSAAHGPSVFFRLGALKPHAGVRVTRADGTFAIFGIDAVRRYAKGAFPTLLVYGNTTTAALRLITCGGTFDRRTGHYEDNIVVFATLIQAQ